MCEIGKIYLRQNNYEEAKKYFEEVLKKDRYNRRANIMFGNLYLKMNDTQEDGIIFTKQLD